ncbi:MAG: hypothetical protein Q8N18_03045 [Opitutaceae bacterium]|nr:hypothetical protein [Opitutaceae bacterium]
MRSKLILMLSLVIGLASDLSAFDPKSMKDCRLAFLLGLGWGDGGNAVFGSKEHDREFERVARACAKDRGASDAELRGDAWREKVISALHAANDPEKRIAASMNDSLKEAFGADVWRRIDVVSAYVAGAYARHGTDSGFRMINQAKGTYLVLVIQLFASVRINLAINPGMPGNLIITLSGGGKDELADFFAEMRTIREVIERAK